MALDFLKPNGPTLEGQQPFRWKHQKWVLLYCIFFVLGAVLYGYDGTYFTGIVAMPAWLRHFGDKTSALTGEPDIKSSTLSLLSSIVQAGELIGSLSAGLIGDYTGRKGGLVAAGILVSVGAIIQMSTLTNVNFWTGGRFVLGAGVGVISNCVPLYLSEVAPLQIRAIVVANWQFMLAIGQVIGACVAQGTHTIDNSASWRIPVGLNLVIPAIFFAFIWAIPESSRWYVSKDRDDQARKALVKTYRSDPDFDVEHSLKEMQQDRQRHRDEAGGSSWSSLFTNPIERRKLRSAFGILAMQQIGGVQFIFSYATVLAKNLQLANPFLITIIIDIIEVVGVIIGFFLVERVGRKPLLLWCTAGEVVSLIIVGGMGSGPMLEPTVPPPAYGQTGIAFICVYVLLFNMSWGPLAWAVATEMCPGPNRSRIMGVATAAFWLVAWAVTFTLPYLYNYDEAGLGLKIGYIYAALCFVSAMFVWLCIGETKGKSLETINQLFQREIPSREWVKYGDELGQAVEQEKEQAIEETEKKGVTDAAFEERVEYSSPA